MIIEASIQSVGFTGVWLNCGSHEGLGFRVLLFIPLISLHHQEVKPLS